MDVSDDLEETTVVVGCPECGSALLREYVLDHDLWFACVAIDDDRVRVGGGVEWIKDRGSHDELEECFRCGTACDRDDLVPVTAQEEAQAEAELDRLRDSVDDEWEVPVDRPAKCPHCGSTRMVVKVRRESTLGAMYEREVNGSTFVLDHFPAQPWEMEAEVRECGSCLTPLTADDLVAG